MLLSLKCDRACNLNGSITVLPVGFVAIDTI